MTWVLAILIVLALGGVAVVAAGRGTPMAEEYDDRPDALVPADRPLVGADLRRVRFSLAVRGYRMSEVDALLDRVAAQLEQATQPEHAAERGQAGGTERPAAGPADQPPSGAVGDEGRGDPRDG